MKYAALSSRRWTTCLLAIITCCALAAHAGAQPKPVGGARGPGAEAAKTPPKTPATPVAPPATAGKAAQTPTQALEERLMGTLATRDMKSLLDHYFKKNNIPEAKQKSILAYSAITEMMSPTVTAARKHELLHDAVQGADTLVANIRDTAQLMNVAGIFIEVGIKGQINQIEYFGESPTRLADLNATSAAVVKILDKAVEECEAQQNALLAGKVRPEDAVMKKWQELDDRLQAAKWTRAFSAYGLALSMDPADKKRKEIAQAASAFLKEFESPEYQREATVRIQIGKLHMVSAEWDAAIKKFQEAGTKKPDKFGEYEIKFYTTMTNLMAKRDKAADAALKDLSAWCKTKLTPEEQKEVSAGVGLLEYRICELRASATKNPGEQRKIGEEGEAALTRVMKDHPKLEPVIKRMLLEKLPANADITKLDVVLLRALVAKGVDEYIRAKEGPTDDKGRPIVLRAVSAAREIQKRKGQPTVTEEIEDEAAFLESMLLGKLGKADDLKPYEEAIETSLHYIKEHGKNKERASLALNNALTCVELIRRDPNLMANPKSSELVNRTWELAIASGQRQFTFMYGKRLFDQMQYKKAAEVLGRTPANHPSITHAKFFQFSSVQQLLNEKGLDASTKQALVAQVQKLAAEVNQRIEADLAKAPDDQKPRLMFYKVSATLLSAELSLNELKKPEETLKMLQGIEESAKGMRGESQLVGTALHLRVNALMSLNRTPEAVAEVKKLVEGGSAGAASILYQMLRKMDDSYDLAKKNDDKEKMRVLSGGQAALMKLLIEQTKDEKIKDAYKERYLVLLLNAAKNEDDQTKRLQYLTEAQTGFNELLAKVAENTPKQANIRYRLAVISFELKDYLKVQQELGQLIAQGRLGPPDIREESTDGTGDKFVDNPVYWEGLLRFMQANFELAKADPNNKNYQDAVADNRSVVKAMYINRGKNVGGERLRDEWAKFKAILLPGWDESQAAPATTQPATTQPATKPAP